MTAYIVKVNAENFDTFVNEGTKLLYVGAAWCGPCKVLGPVYDDLSCEFEGRISFGKVDVDEARDNITEYGNVEGRTAIRNIPTVVLLKDGKEIERLVGTKANRETIKDMIERNI